MINRKWIVDKDEYHIGRFKEEVFIISSKDLKEKGIAEVYDSESNALLISKAPEMLEILQEVVRKVSVAE